MPRFIYYHQKVIRILFYIGLLSVVACAHQQPLPTVTPFEEVVSTNSPTETPPPATMEPSATATTVSTETSLPSATTFPSATPLTTPTLPAATPHPIYAVPIPDGYVQADYYSNWYGLSFAHPSDWRVVEYSEQTDLENVFWLTAPRRAATIYLYRHSVAQYGTADPEELLTDVLLQDPNIIKLLDFHTSLSHDLPEKYHYTFLDNVYTNSINNQSVALSIVAVETEEEVISTTAVVIAEVINGTSGVLILGSPINGEVFLESFNHLVETLVISEPNSDPQLILGEELDIGVGGYHLFQPDLYPFYAEADLSYIIMGKHSIPFDILAIDNLEDPADLDKITQQGDVTQLATTDLPATDPRSIWGSHYLIFSPPVSGNYYIAGGGGFPENLGAFYLLLSPPNGNYRVAEQRTIKPGEMHEWSFEIRPGEAMPIIIEKGQDLNIGLAFYDEAGNEVDHLLPSARPRERMGYVFSPERDGLYTIQINCCTYDSTGEYTIWIADLSEAQD